MQMGPVSRSITAVRPVDGYLSRPVPASARLRNISLSLDWQAYTPMPASEEALTAFHHPDYISFLRHVTPDNQVRLLDPARVIGFRVQTGCSIGYSAPAERCALFVEVVS